MTDQERARAQANAAARVARAKAPADLAVDTYAGSLALGLTYSHTTKHSGRDDQLARLDALADAWRAAGYKVEHPAVGVLVAWTGDRWHMIGGAALARDRTTHAVMPADRVERALGCGDAPAGFSRERARVARPAPASAVS